MVRDERQYEADWRGRAKLDKVTYVFGNIGDPVALATQERFHYYIAKTPDIAGQLAKNPNYTVKNVEYIQPGRRQFNTSLPKYADPRIRKAVAYAIDRDTLTKQIYQGATHTGYFLGAARTGRRSLQVRSGHGPEVAEGCQLEYRADGYFQ